MKTLLYMNIWIILRVEKVKKAYENRIVISLNL
jgi:hypothetical protein